MDTKKSCCYKIKKWCCHHKWVIAGIMILLLFFIEKTCLDFFTDSDEGIDRLHAYLIVALTFGILCAAWINLGGMSKTIKGDFLLRLDERYNGKEMAVAKKIIKKIECEERKNYDKKINATDDTVENEITVKEKESEIATNIAIRIKEMNSTDDTVENEITLKEKESEIDSRNGYIILHDFLDFMETIAFFSNRQYLYDKDLEKLLGMAIIGYFLVFKELILFLNIKTITRLILNS